MLISSKFVAPWALVKEQFPLHLFWQQGDNFDLIELNIPCDLTVQEILNVRSFSVERDKVTFKRDDMFTSNYFAAILVATKVYRETVVKKQIEVKFVRTGKVIHVERMDARIVRPSMRFRDPPSTITINDNSDLNRILKLGIVHSGLGRAEVRIDIQARGRLISEPDTLYYHVIKELIEDLATGIEVSEGEDIQEKVPDIVFDPVRLHQEALDILNRLQSGELTQGVKVETIEKLNYLLKDEKFKTKLLNTIYTKLRRIYLSYMVYFFDRYPHEDVELPLGKIKVNLSASIQQMLIKLTYFDKHRNEYEAIETAINIRDQRTSRDHFAIPLNLEWSSEPFKIEQFADGARK